jgi:hypothetical protein
MVAAIAKAKSVVGMGRIGHLEPVGKETPQTGQMLHSGDSRAPEATKGLAAPGFSV